MAKCQHCGKGPIFGRSRSHAFNTTNRKFKPNLQKVSIYEGGTRIQKTLCTKCIKTLGKEA
ncbi:MAG: 50S ribosomal protein L28 [Anaerolineae bacterium]|jgi:large subunit ribosomal protein L28|nr:50S ribosomal protein L28 [Anaerolineae bacterium]